MNKVEIENSYSAFVEITHFLMNDIEQLDVTAHDGVSMMKYIISTRGLGEQVL